MSTKQSTAKTDGAVAGFTGIYSINLSISHTADGAGSQSQLI